LVNLKQLTNSSTFVMLDLERHVDRCIKQQICKLCLPLLTLQNAGEEKYYRGSVNTRAEFELRSSIRYL
jgi:hypothetical protein